MCKNGRFEYFECTFFVPKKLIRTIRLNPKAIDYGKA